MWKVGASLRAPRERASTGGVVDEDGFSTGKGKFDGFPPLSTNSSQECVEKGKLLSRRLFRLLAGKERFAAPAASDFLNDQKVTKGSLGVCSGKAHRLRSCFQSLHHPDPRLQGTPGRGAEQFCSARTISGEPVFRSSLPLCSEKLGFPLTEEFAPRSPSRLAGSMSALKRRHPAMAQPRRRFLGGISDSFSERVRQRAGPGFVTPLLHAPNRIFPDRRMDKGST